MIPDVSAVIIVRDGERFIREAIESILTQEGTALELIVVDDGSVDATADIVRSYGDRAQLACHPGNGNRGMSASRNLGIERSRGRFVAFLDADDVWLPGKALEQVAILDAEPSTAMVYGRTLIWNSWNAAADDFMYSLGVPPDRTYPPGRLFRQLLRNRYQSPTTCNAMMRREALLAVGGAAPHLRGLFEDQLLFAKLLARYPVHVSSRCWAKYRQHDLSSSALGADRLEGERCRLAYLLALSDDFRDSHGISLRDKAALARTIAQVRAMIALRVARRRLGAPR